MFEPAPDWSPETRILEICSCEDGYYFTVHRDTFLIYQSPNNKDRVATTEAGIQYLDVLRKVEQEMRNQIKKSKEKKDG